MNHDIFPTMSHKVHLLTKHYYKPYSNDVKLWKYSNLYTFTGTSQAQNNSEGDLFLSLFQQFVGCIQYI